MRWAKEVWFAFVVFALVGMVQLAVAQVNTSSVQKAALVNGKVITHEELERNVFVYQQRLFKETGQVVRPEKIPEVRNRVLQDLIDQELLYQESQKRSIKIEESVVNERLRLLRRQFRSEEDFKEAMVEASVSEKALKSQIARNLAIDKFMEEEFVKRTDVSDAEKESFYESNPEFFKKPEQVRASHVLVRLDAGASTADKNQAREKVESIKKSSEQGEDFAALAQKFSDCPSKAKGGDLGYFARGQMVKPFEDAAFGLDVGKLSEVVETEYGYHLIKVIDKKAERKMGFKEVEKDIEQYLIAQKVNKEKNTFINKLKQKAKVETFLIEPENPKSAQ